MDENKQVGAVNPSENPTFDQLTMDEKRRLIAALSMGRLNEDEKREFAGLVRRSQLTENERAQISRAFAMSRMTDEERRALLTRRQQEKSVGTAAGAQAPTTTPTAAPPVPDSDSE